LLFLKENEQGRTILVMMIKKSWLTIGEVADLVGVPIHTIRYWEGEFNGYLRPERTNGRQRRYNEQSVQKILEIKSLLRKEKYSIAGARQVLDSRNGHSHYSGLN